MNALGTTGYESAYEVELDLPVGPISLTINAVTAASESKTSVWKYEVLPEDAFLYDENGNLIDDKTRTYEWDAENRLVGIQETASGNRSEFAYDGFSRRVKMVEKTGITTDSDRRYVWDGLSVAESRLSDGETVEKSYFSEGFKAGSDAYYYTRDHLGSIRGLVDASDVERGRWDFGPWGERSANLVSSSPVEVDFGYTGHWNHARSGLALAPYRAYSAEHKRWISRDPMEGIIDKIPELIQGPNLYSYVTNDPINLIDPTGLNAMDLLDPNYREFRRSPGGMAAIAAPLALLAIPAELPAGYALAANLMGTYEICPLATLATIKAIGETPQGRASLLAASRILAGMSLYANSPGASNALRAVQSMTSTYSQGPK